MNFLNLICHPLLSERKGYIALSDQDDVWLPHKLSRGLAHMRTVAPGDPALYGCRTILVNEDLTERGPSRLYRRRPSFANALVQNILAGNTMLLNKPAWDLIRHAGPQPSVPFHDWWIYLLMSGSGAHIHADPLPGLLYRQHGSNTLGANLGRGALQRRLSLLKNRHFKSWVKGNTKALTRSSAHLSRESRQKLKLFRQRHLRARLPAIFMLLRHDIRRQSKKQTLMLYVAYLVGRF